MRPEHKDVHLNYRFEVEQVIVGAVLLDQGAYGCVANILSAQNFTKWPRIDFKQVWAAIARLYPDEPIDVITVTHYLQKLGCDWLVAYEISKCTNRVASSANVEYHAMLLLEYDIRLKFCELLLGASTSLSMTQNKTHSAALQECYDNMNGYDNDLFEGIDASISYLGSVGLEDVLMDRLKNFNDDLNKKIMSMRNVSQIKSVLNNLKQFKEHARYTASDGYNQAYALDLLADVVKLVWMKKEVTDDDVSKIVDLKNGLLNTHPLTPLERGIINTYEF